MAVQPVFAMFPPVPIFFVISGFLISNSFLNNDDLWRYFKARALRIYPALFMAVIFSALLMAYLGFWQQVESYKAFRWMVYQSTGYFVFRMPKPFEGLTGGVVNGVLWSISVEVAFYVILPLILWFHRSKPWVSSALTTMLMAVSAYLVTTSTQEHPHLRGGFLMNFWFLGWGILARLHWDEVKDFLQSWETWFVLHAVAFVLWVAMAYQGETVIFASLWLTFTLVPLTLSFCHAKTYVVKEDISYGMYLFHLLGIHLFSHSGLTDPIPLIVLVVSLAYLSWTLVEKPCLTSFRHQPIKG